MKKLSEVCKIVGISRRTLQWYDRIELVRPTQKDKNGYWFYDDIAINELILIQILVEAEFSLKEIKSVLENPEFDIFQMFGDVVERLDKKCNRIQAKIRMLKIIEMNTLLAESILSKYGNLNPAHIYSEKSFCACLEDSIDYNLKHNELDEEKAKLAMTFWYSISAVGYMMLTPEDDAHVQVNVERAYTAMKNLIDLEDEKSETDFLIRFDTKMQSELSSDSELIQMIESRCGDGASEYIMRAIRIFVDEKKKYLGSIL